VQFFTDNLLLFAIAFASGGMLLWPVVRARTGGPTVTTLEATRLINSKNAQIIDVRAANDFASGALPNSKNIPSTNIKDRLGELKKERPVILVCDSGRTSGPAAAQLRAGGFSEVYVLAGGIAGWREAGLPLRK
jgi:rhodanese-related sulfurtransferase